MHTRETVTSDVLTTVFVVVLGGEGGGDVTNTYTEER